MKGLKLIGFFLLITLDFAQCQTYRYDPGFDFGLFINTSAGHLANAVEKEDTAAIAKFVLKDNVPVDYKEKKFGNSLLMLAVENNKELSVAKLLELGADPNVRAFDNTSPFLIACAYAFNLKNPSKMLLLLINSGADVNSVQIDTTLDQFGRKKNFKATALRLLCLHGNLESVKVLVEHGSSLDVYGENEAAILSTAVLSGKLDIVKYLMINRKASIPEFVVIRQPGTKSEKKMTISDLLNENDYKGNLNKEQLRNEILVYLREHGKH
jgi:ankyrin repeat protein